MQKVVALAIALLRQINIYIGRKLVKDQGSRQGRRAGREFPPPDSAAYQHLQACVGT